MIAALLRSPVIRIIAVGMMLLALQNTIFADMRPAGVSLQVADATGLFKPARAGLGFPAGKDKTVLIDLAGLFPAKGPRRVRLSTNLEIFWDRMGWAART